MLSGLLHVLFVNVFESRQTKERVMKATDVIINDIATVEPDSSVDDAIKLLVEHDFSALPVVDDSGPIHRAMITFR